MFDKINDWNNVDLMKFKVTPFGMEQGIYYLDGHKIYDQKLTENDIQFVEFVRKLKCYGNSEVIVNNSKNKDQFYVRANISSEYQQEKIITYLCENLKMTNEQKSVLLDLEKIDDILKIKDDYKALYFLGFISERTQKKFKKIKFYFRLNCNEESQESIFDYFEQLEYFRKDKGFDSIKKLVSEKIRLEFIGVEFDEIGRYKIKFYVSSDLKCQILFKLIQNLGLVDGITENLQQIDCFLKNNIDLNISLLQISTGKSAEENSIDFYLESKNKHKKVYYTLNKNIRVRDIGGVNFIVDIHEKAYYDKKDLYRINETGKLIIQYMNDNTISNIDGVVSYIKSKINNYEIDMNDIIYADCKEFIELLLKEGYIYEVN